MTINLLPLDLLVCLLVESPTSSIISWIGLLSVLPLQSKVPLSRTVERYGLSCEINQLKKSLNQEKLNKTIF